MHISHPPSFIGCHVPDVIFNSTLCTGWYSGASTSAAQPLKVVLTSSNGFVSMSDVTSISTDYPWALCQEDNFPGKCHSIFWHNAD